MNKPFEVCLPSVLPVLCENHLEKVDGKLGLKRGHGLTVHHTEKGTNDRT